jgi:hypothetical protein
MKTNGWVPSAAGSQPLKTLESSQPVADVVQAAYLDAFKAKEWLSIGRSVASPDLVQMSHKEATVAIKARLEVSGLKRSPRHTRLNT